MRVRIGSVIILVLSSVWLARDPGWEPLIAFLTALGAYIGLEISQQRKNRRDPSELNRDARARLKIEGRVESAEEENILVHISREGSKEAEEIMDPLGLSKIKAEFYCERLEAHGFLDRAAVWMDRRPFHLTQKAKEWLIKTGHVV